MDSPSRRRASGAYGACARSSPARRLRRASQAQRPSTSFLVVLLEVIARVRRAADLPFMSDAFRFGSAAHGRLGAVMAIAIVHPLCRDGAQLLAHPSGSSRAGGDVWPGIRRSSSTRIVALKLGPIRGGIARLHFCGGRGRHSRQTPSDLIAAGERAGFRRRRPRPGEGWSPRSTARGAGRLRSLLHVFIVTDDGKWRGHQVMNKQRHRAPYPVWRLGELVYARRGVEGRGRA